MDFVQFPNQDSMFLSSLAIIMIVPKGWSFSLSCIIINSIDVLLLVFLIIASFTSYFRRSYQFFFFLVLLLCKAK